MFGFLKRLFSKPVAPEQFPISTPPAQTTFSPLPARSQPVPQAASAPQAPAGAFQAPSPSPQPASTPAVAGLDGVLKLPLTPILASLPPNLAALVAAAAEGTFSLPLKTALAQLASGAVRIPFGELRQGSPPGTFYDNTTQDRSLVSLPLGQILSLIDPALLPRRVGQKSVSVPESVTNVFGQGRSLQAPIAGPEPIRPPAPPSPARTETAEAGPSYLARRPVTPALPSRLPRTPSPASLATPPATPKLPSMTTPPPPVMEKESFSVPLAAISESWPVAVLQEIAQLQLHGATFHLPASRLEQGLKAGRVVFAWSELCQWLQPAPPKTLSANGDAALELPLEVVAPLFLAQRRLGGASRKLAFAANIPDQIPSLFSRSPAASATAAPVPGAPAPAAGPASGFGGIFDVQGQSDWPPPEICRRICALEGVTGSAISTSDGLVVAAQWPPALKADLVAAFLPQIFGRVSQSAAEIQLGGVTSVVLGAGQGRCAIYKTGKLYLAVLGHPGAVLPEAMLGRIAAELAKRNP